MGACWSCDDGDRHESAYAAWVAPARPQRSYAPYSYTSKLKPKPLYGEFKCSCGYFWVSRLSWPDRYQQCKRCKSSVRPKNQRELRPTDFQRDRDDVGEHPRELCEMCQRLGRHCGQN